MFTEFIDAYGMEILMAIVTALGGYIGIAVKRLYEKYINTKEKESVVKTVVQGVEQMYKDLHGEDKLNQALTAASEMLTGKGISFTEFELRMLIEAAVGEFNEAFKKDNNSSAE